MNRIESGGGFCRPRHALVRSLLGLALLIAGQAKADLHIKQMAGIPDRGIVWTYGYIVPYVSPRDRQPLLVFSSGIPNCPSAGLHFYRQLRVNRYELIKVDTGNTAAHELLAGNLLPWASGDVGGDSLPELFGDNGESHPTTFYLDVTLYRPPADAFCPDSLAWSSRYDSLATDACCPFYITDLDQDGKKEITFQHEYRGLIFVYENSGPDSLRQAAAIPSSNGSGLAFGDFDLDGRTEFAIGSYNSSLVKVFKCTGDDQYVLSDTVRVPVNGNYGEDVFEGRNIDGTHHAVFFASFWNATTGWGWLYEFEHGPDSLYHAHPVDSATFSTSDVWARSICGDIVGAGDIRKCISALRVERSIKRHGPQSVTWAEVPEDLQARVAAYLADKLDPAERETNPDIERLQVNLPYTP